MKRLIYPIKAMLKMYKEGMSVEEIAQALSGPDWRKYWMRTTGQPYTPSAQVVHKVLDRAGCQFREVGAEHGDQHWNWKGGRFLDKCGYVMVLCPDHPKANAKGYVREHRLVMERIVGRYLTEEEVVHHINCVKHDNREENLMLFENNSEHLAYELKGIKPKYLRDRESGSVGDNQW